MKYTVPVIVFLLVLQFKDVFFTDPDPYFSDRIWILADPYRIRTQKKSLIRIREKIPDPKHWKKHGIHDHLIFTHFNASVAKNNFPEPVLFMGYRYRYLLAVGYDRFFKSIFVFNF